MNVTSIGWTDFSANPLKYRDANGRVVWGCSKVSPGCTHCYSEALAKRWNKGSDYNDSEMAKLTPFLDDKEIRAMLTKQAIDGKAVSGSRVFVGDMTDIFGAWVPDELLDRLFTTFAERPDVTFQVLTKRADRMRDYLSDGRRRPLRWPLSNVWLGVSVENQERLDRRIPKLLTTPALVRFVSAEPLLGDVWFHDFAHTPTIDWVIVGGESGSNYRPCPIDAILSVVDQCRASSVPVFVKQDAHRLPGQQGRIPSEFYLHEFPDGRERTA